MTDDEDLGKTYDLDAWAAPAPSSSLADGVIARLRQPPAVVAIEPEAGRRSRRWWFARPGAPGRAASPKATRRWIAAALAGTLAVAATIALVAGGMTRAPDSGGGAVIADKARSVELGDSHVQLDPGAELTWERAGHRVRAVLRKGAATFSIAGDDTFLIDGASLASVEATGASLRMEANMTASDPRVIGASAVTAAMVAVLTIVVYEGHVKASHEGTTQTVEVGGTLEVRAPVPAPPVAVGAGPDYKAMLDAQDREIERLKAELEEARRLATGDATQSRPAQKKPSSPPPVACDAGALTTRADDMAASGMWAAALASYEASMKCKPDAMLIKKAAIAACNSKNAAKAKLYFARLPAPVSTGLVQICVRNGIDVGDATCDATAEKEKGEDALGAGMDAKALTHFDRALDCGAGADVEKLATLAACRAKNAESARRHWARLSDQSKQQLVQPCVRNGIDLEDAPAVTAGTGTLALASKPSARVFLDGKDTGKTTPLQITASPGRHKVTFMIDGSKYTFSVQVEAGQTTRLVKSFE